MRWMDILERRSAMSTRDPSIWSSISIESRIVLYFAHLEALKEDLNHDDSAIAMSDEVSPCGRIQS